ncbi:NAD(P)-dependent dehydrogenase (short-subunit alcohol dehydrogenase family) [Paenibacillus rhizosphaerae]|uniref:Probable oxidoreductase n=1 Tax=Paenibacillus rhizosphaerae TaxID=297318 RepID=A0A839TT30_9BACL|nr:oxidoreductase [Paenibacillus rhizosphaerae]MBB3128548.1 NAD(P)-dependent dehydrogenase (short-subunit alcohol dehydrogenase family) [Paenibacillus rhizosphaerae]
MDKANWERTPQWPLNTGYGPRTTAEEVIGNIDLNGKTAIVTGGYAGLGLEVSRVLAKAGARIIVPARSLQKAEAAVASIPGVELAELDLADPVSIDRFAHTFERSGRPLHILVNCAGIMATSEQRDGRGYELQFATNHLGHFQLTARLWPALERANGARVVSVSSGAHRLGGINFEDLNFLSQPYDKWKAYGQSKTATALFALELDKKGAAHHVRAFSVHPGTIVTDLSRHLSDDEMKAMGALDEQGQRTITKMTSEHKTIPEGAATIVWCAVSKQLDGKGGVYCQNVDIAQPVPKERIHEPGIPGVFPWAMDIQAAERLWQLSEKLTGVSFQI